MLTRFFVLFSATLILSGCHAPPKSTTPSQLKTSQVRDQSTFTRVQVDGLIDVSLHTGYKKPTVILRGDARDLTNVTTKVSNGTLYVHVGEGYPDYGRIKADIRGQYLNAFAYHGSGVITGTKLHASLFDIDLDNEQSTTLGGYLGLRQLSVKGQGKTNITGIQSRHLNLNLSNRAKVRLNGVVNLAEVTMDDNAWLSLYWVNSNVLKVRGKDKAYIQLAGIAEKLLVELCDSARFNGRYLRANRAFVKTHDQARAEISAVKRQHTLASDASDIHFYNIPEMKTDFMAFNGSVLDLRDWNMPFMQEYDQYNK